MLEDVSGFDHKIYDPGYGHDYGQIKSEHFFSGAAVFVRLSKVDVKYRKYYN